jgi:hypothetical protein
LLLLGKRHWRQQQLQQQQQQQQVHIERAGHKVGQAEKGCMAVCDTAAPCCLAVCGAAASCCMLLPPCDTTVWKARV